MDRIVPSAAQMNVISDVNDDMGYIQAIRLIRAFYKDERGAPLGLKEAKELLGKITS